MFFFVFKINRIIRTIIIYLSVTVGIRCMGKRQMGELSTTEMSVTLLISEVAATPIMEKNVPLYHGIIVVIICGNCSIIIGSDCIIPCINDIKMFIPASIISPMLSNKV